jgi:hypothetical protein
VDRPEVHLEFRGVSWTEFRGQTDLILWEKHKSVEVRTRVRLEGEFQGQEGVKKLARMDPIRDYRWWVVTARLRS